MKRKVIISMATIFLIGLIDDTLIAIGFINSISLKTYLLLLVGLPLFLYLIAPLVASFVPGGGILMRFRFWFISFAIGALLMVAVVYFVWPRYITPFLGGL